MRKSLLAIELFFANRRLCEANSRTTFSNSGNYFSDQEPSQRISNASEIWGTEEWLALNVVDRKNLCATFSFSWQHEDDCNIVTVYVENGECAGSSIDG